MKLNVAGTAREYADGLTVAQLLELEKVEMPQYISVSVNDGFVRSESFAETVLREGDTVEFLYFMGGGQ